MRRRWKWPILTSVKDLDKEELAFGWAIGGIFPFVPALCTSTDAHSDLVWTWWLAAELIAWLGPFALALLVWMIRVTIPNVPKLVPRRISEPVREDLRAAHQRQDA